MSDDVDARGWDAISDQLAMLYPGQEPRHFAALVSYSLGGPDPLNGISAYRSKEARPHWHFITYGFSELFAKETDDPAVSGYGFELTFRLACAEDSADPPTWPLNFLQNLARYVFESGNAFGDGDWMTANGPIALAEGTKICSMAFVDDPQLASIQTPNGELKFLQVVGLTKDEETAAKSWATKRLLELLLPSMPLWITDLHRACLLSNPSIAENVAAGLSIDGSSQGYMYTDVLLVEVKRRLLRKPLIQVTLGARQVEQLRKLLPLRLPFSRPFMLAGPEFQLVFKPSDKNLETIEDNVLTVELTPQAVQTLVLVLLDKEGRYAMPGLSTVEFNVQKTMIRDADGKIVETLG